MFLFYGILLTICSTSIADLEVGYILTTNDGISTNFTKDNYTDVYFDSDPQYKIICHGWLSHQEWYPSMIKAYIQKKNTAVISVYYFEALSDFTYIGSVANVPIVGEMVGKMIIDLHASKNIPLKNFHLIGHSLGGQIIGVAGEYVRTTEAISVARLTALDPAFPGFYSPFTSYEDHNRLSKEDADFVDVIHASFLSVPKAIGHADFFVNGGSYQMECTNITSDIRLICAHHVPILLFILSISGRHLEARECADYDTFKNGGCDDAPVVAMGDGISQDSIGTFYISIDYDLMDDYDVVFKN